MALYIPIASNLEKTLRDHLVQPVHIELLNDCNEEFIECFKSLNSQECIHNLLSITLRCKNQNSFNQLHLMENIAPKIKHLSFLYNFQELTMENFKKFSSLCRINLFYLLQETHKRTLDLLSKNGDFKEKTAVLKFLQENGRKNGEEAGIFFRGNSLTFVCEKRKSQDDQCKEKHKFQRSQSLPGNKLKHNFSPDMADGNRALKYSQTQVSLLPEQTSVSLNANIGELLIAVPENDIDGRKIVGILSNSLAYPVGIKLKSTADQIRAIDEFLKNNREKLSHIESLTVHCDNHWAFYALKKAKFLAPKVTCLSLDFALQKKDLTSNFSLFDNLISLKTPNINLDLIENSAIKNKMHKNKENLMTSKIMYTDLYSGIFDKILTIKANDIRYHDLCKILKTYREINKINIEGSCEKEYLEKLIRLEKDKILDQINEISLVVANSEIFNALCGAKSLSNKITRLKLGYIPRTKFSNPKYARCLLAFENLAFFLAQSDEEHPVLPKCQDIYELCHKLHSKSGYIQISCPNTTFLWTSEPQITSPDELPDHAPCFRIENETLYVLSEHINLAIYDILNENPDIQRVVVEIKNMHMSEYLNTSQNNSMPQHSAFNQIHEFVISCNVSDIINKFPDLSDAFRQKITELTLSFSDKKVQEKLLTQLNLFPNLQSLRIKEAPVFKDEYFQYFKNLKKIKIDFWHPLQNETIPYLKQCSKLTELSLFGGCIKDDGLAQLTSIPLKKVTFKECPYLTVKGLSCLPFLESINFQQRYPLAYDDLIQYLSGLSQLQELVLSDNHEKIYKNEGESTQDYLKRLLNYNVLTVESLTEEYENLLEKLKNNDNRFDTLCLREVCTEKLFDKITQLKNAKVLEKIKSLILTCANSTVFNNLCKSNTLSNKISELTLAYTPRTKFSEPKYGKALSKFGNLQFFFTQSGEEHPVLPKCKEMYELCKNLINKNGYMQISCPESSYIWAHNPPVISNDFSLTNHPADYRITNGALCVFSNGDLQKNIIRNILERNPQIDNVIITGNISAKTIQTLDALEKLVSFNQVHKFSIDCTNDDTLIALYEASETLRGKIHTLKFSRPIDSRYMIKAMRWDIFRKFKNLKFINMVRPDNLDTIHHMFFNHLINFLERDKQTDENYYLKLNEQKFQNWPVDLKKFKLTTEPVHSEILEYLIQNPSILHQIEELNVWVNGESGLQEILESNLKEKVTELTISPKNPYENDHIVKLLPNFPRLRKYENEVSAYWPRSKP